MNWMLKSLLVTATLLLPSAAYADENRMPGEWQQVSSNAGQCNSCKVTIMRHGSVLTIEANNGWSAVVQTDTPGNAPWAVGKGRWQKGKGGPYSGTPFDIALLLKGQQLQMVMLSQIGNRRAGTIKASFKRQYIEEPPTKM